MLPTSLLVKSLIVRTPLASAARNMRWLFAGRSRHKHPELWEVYLEERWMPLVLQRVLKKESCAVDVGGHIGSFLILLMKYAPKGSHVVFEASVTKSQWLRSRFPEVRVFPYAVADKAGRAVFQEDYTRPGYSTLQFGRGESGAMTIRYEVQTCRLDDVLLEMDRVDLIKLDIEGGELAALRGATKVIKRWNPVIIFECGSEYGLAEQKLSRMDLYRFIVNNLGYNVFNFADFLFDKGEMSYDEFRKCGLFPFRAFNFIALPRSATKSVS